MLGEDNVLVREGVRALLDSYEDVEVVGVAADAPSLLSAAEEHTPDVVVTDIKMPPNFQLEGIDCAHAIRETHPGTGVVVLSAHDDEAYAIALLGKGQSGLAYLLKDRIAQGDELVRAIREVAAGGSAVDPLIAERLSGRRETGEHDRELLELMSQGLGYEQMAENLGTTPEAVDRRVTQLFTRMAAQAEGGGAAAVDEMKRLHAAVVQKQAHGDRVPVVRARAGRGQAAGVRIDRASRGARRDDPVLRHPRLLDAGRTPGARAGGRARRRPSRGHGRGDHRPRRDGGSVRRGRGHGRVRRARADRRTTRSARSSARSRCRRDRRS